jgi:flagellar hook-associated protein 2
MRDSLGKLTASGSGGKDRGAFAGDAGIASLERELNNMVRTNIDGLDMTKFGITADKDGKLELDSEKLEKMLTDNPTQLTALFNGNEGLIKKMDKSLDKYLNSTNGVIKGRQESLDRQETQLTDRSDKISTRYDNSYNRYLKQFTQLQQVMSQMNNTMSMFGLV